RVHPILAALEVDSPVGALGSAAAMAGSLAPVYVAAAALLQPFHQSLLGLGLGDLSEVRVGEEAPAGARGLGLADCHGETPSSRRPAGPGRSGWSRPRAPARWPSS